MGMSVYKCMCARHQRPEMHMMWISSPLSLLSMRGSVRERECGRWTTEYTHKLGLHARPFNGVGQAGRSVKNTWLDFKEEDGGKQRWKVQWVGHHLYGECAWLCFTHNGREREIETENACLSHNSRREKEMERVRWMSCKASKKGIIIQASKTRVKRKP